MAPIFEAQGLTKYYRNQWTLGRFCVLKEVDLLIEEGEIFGLIGPNGAGKTTTFKLLLGLLRPSAGRIAFCGQPVDTAARAAIGFLPEQPYFYDHLTVQETLDFYARLYGLGGAQRRHRVQEVIEQVQVAPKRQAPLRTLSKGTLQRVGVAQALLNHPRLVVLDEPMSGLDPAGRRHMRELIRTLQQGGTTVIFSSHILPDAELLCTRVGILVDGQLREVVDVRGNGTPSAYLLRVGDADAATLAALERIAGSPLTPDDGGAQVRLPDQAAVRAALGVIATSAAVVRGLTAVHPSLEERFLAYVTREANLD